MNDMAGITEYGFCISDAVENGKPIGEKIVEFPITSITDDKQISGTITELIGGKTYYVWVYAKNGKTIGYSEYRDFTTKRIPGEDDNVSPDKKD